MCSQAEWDKLRRRAEDALASEDVRELMSEAAARFEALIDEIKVWTCAPEEGMRSPTSTASAVRVGGLIRAPRLKRP